MKVRAIVYRGRKRRFGKGFSREELKAAGLSVREASALKIPVDLRRRTKHDENIKFLREYLESIKGREDLKGKI